MNSVNLNCLFKDLIPKHSHILRYRLGLQHVNLEERDKVQPWQHLSLFLQVRGFGGSSAPRGQFC